MDVLVKRIKDETFIVIQKDALKMNTIPLMKRAWASGDRLVVIESACHGSIDPLGKMIFETLTPRPP